MMAVYLGEAQRLYKNVGRISLDVDDKEPPLPIERERV